MKENNGLNNYSWALLKKNAILFFII